MLFFIMAETVLDIKPLASAAEAEACSAMMVSTEPWLTLGRRQGEAYALLMNTERETYVAYAGVSLAGVMVLCMKGAFVGYLNAICVAEGMRGRGIGTQMVAYAEERIFREYPNVFLCVSGFNHGAQRLYERLGYERIGELKNYVIKGQSEILMRKSRGPLTT